MIIAQITTGIILGPNILGNEALLWKHRDQTFSEDSIRVLGTMSTFGYMFFMFLNAVKMDLSLIKKAGNKAVLIGFSFILLPLLTGYLLNTCLNPKGENVPNKVINEFFIAIFYSSSAFPVIHCLLNELKIINSELGRLSLLAAMISDVFSMILLSLTFISEIIINHLDKLDTVLVNSFLLVIVFLLVVVCVCRPTMNWMISRTPNGAPVRDAFLYAIITVFLVSPQLAHKCGLFRVFGPILVGLAVPDGPPLGSILVDKFETVVNGLLLPLFVTTCAMRIDFSELDLSISYVRYQGIIAVLLLLVKFGVSMALPLCCDMPVRDSLAFGFVMNARGIVELGSFSFLNDIQIISNNLFAFLTVIIVVMAIASPMMVKLLYDPSRKYASYQKRNIMNCKLQEELQLVACIHVPSDVTTIINLLNSSCPTSHSPLTVNVLHLVKLIGQSTPLFISHQNHIRTVSNKPYSENVVLAFNQFERDNWEAVKVNVFTAVSPASLMHEDIRNLALDKLTSIVILPFHRRWSIDGTVEAEDRAIRSLNCNILNTAPCSVGILVEGRRHLRRTSSSKDASTRISMYNIAVIFLGGNDDREALTLAKRFSLDARVNLTVIHLKAPRILGNAIVEQDRLLDEEILEDVTSNEYVTYVEEEVKDGPETSMLLQSMVNVHHLIIVGRQYGVEMPQTEGLKEWSEFEELGIIGDLLACSDFSGSYSLLVIQQQQQRIR